MSAPSPSSDDDDDDERDRARNTERAPQPSARGMPAAPVPASGAGHAPLPPRLPLLLIAVAFGLYSGVLDDRKVLSAIRRTMSRERAPFGGLRGNEDGSWPGSASSSSSSYPFQCNRTWAPKLGWGRPRCADTTASLRYGRREERDGVFFPWQPDAGAGAAARTVAAAASDPGTPVSRPPGRRCGLRWYSPAEACRLLSSSGRLVVFIGDSLMRHLEQALYIVLTGDYEQGAMLSDKMREMPGLAETCRCDAQFNDFNKANCRLHTRAYFNGPPSEICPSWDRPFLFPLLQWFETSMVNIPALHDVLSDVVSKPVSEGGYGGKALVLVNNALHNNFDSGELLPRVYEPVIEIARGFPSVTVSCVTMLAPQANKPAAFVESQGPAVTKRWNAALRAFCTENGAGVFETHALSADATSHDGTHFGMETNVMLAQALLNMIAELDGDV